VRIAIVTPYLPYPADTGGKIRTFYLLKSLAPRHAVDLYTVFYGNRPALGDQLPQICRRIYPVQLIKNSTNASRLARCFLDPLPRLIDHFYTPAAALEVRRQIRIEPYDLLVLDEICMAPYLEGLPGPKLVLRQKIDYLHYREVNSAEPLGIEKLVGWLEVQKLRHYERRATSEYSAAICCSADDAAQVDTMKRGIPIAVIPNGVDLDFFVPQEEMSRVPTLLYTGTMNYYPNIDAVNYFFREIYPPLARLIPQVHILIVGHNPPEEILAWQSLPGVKITGSVPDIRPYLAECTAAMVPLRLGGGTRLKIMESIAANRAVISTSIGAEGIGLRHGEHLLLADDPVSFAEQAATLLRDRELRRRLITNAKPVVEKRFSWRVLGEQFETVCRELVEKGTP
jgi:glycosyltransferase involved in cell wall biosynthesis